MSIDYPISNEVVQLVKKALAKREHWMAYNQSLHFVDAHDVHFFTSKTAADDFANDNISDRDNFRVIHFNSIQDLYKDHADDQNAVGKEMYDPDANPLYNYEGNAFTDALIDHFEQQQLLNSQIKSNVMNNENLQYLADNIKYMGFGENLKAELEKNLQEGKADFQLRYTAEINKKPFEATLNFRKSDSTDMYFFNSYRASLEKNNAEKVEQTFYINKGKGVTSKEAFNLLEGRSVHKDLMTKEGQPYKAWIQLDPSNKDKNNNFEVKHYHENYGFDLSGAVQKFAIAELKDSDKAKSLMQSLQKGNIQSVTIEKDGASHKMFIEADPQFKKVNLYDSNMKLVSKESMEKYQSIGQAASKLEAAMDDKKKDLKQEVKPEKEKTIKKDNNSLLPKKRESSKKSLGIS